MRLPKWKRRVSRAFPCRTDYTAGITSQGDSVKQTLMQSLHRLRKVTAINVAKPATSERRLNRVTSIGELMPAALAASLEPTLRAWRGNE